jgi:glycerol kinase
MSYVLAIDQGTQSTRASILNLEGKIQAQASIPVTLTRPGDNRVEQDPGLLVSSVERSVAQVLTQVPEKVSSSVECCGIATQRSTVVAWNDHGEPVSAALSWQDTRGQAQLEQLESHKLEIQRCSGLPLSAHYGASKLRWLMDHNRIERDTRLGPLSSFLLSRISDCETSLVDHANAQRMQLLDIGNMQWSESLARLFGIPLSQLPQCCPVSHEFGTLIGTGIPITAMNGDQNAAWFDSGRPAMGSVLVNLGSGAFILATQDPEASAPGLLTTIACSDEATTSLVTEATVNGCGNALAWLAGEYRISGCRSRLIPALEQTREPPLFMNTVGGLGSPWWYSGLAPRFIARGGEPTQKEMIAGVCESILFLVYFNMLQMQKIAAISEVRLSGGLSRVDPLCQKLANLSGLPINRMNQPESTTRGIAWIAAGKPENWRISGYDRFQPNADNGLRARFELFVDRLISYTEGAGNG